MKYFLAFLFLVATTVSAYAQELIWDNAIPFTTQNLGKIAGAAPVVLVISENTVVNGTVEVGPNITLKFIAKGRLQIANEQSFLRIKGPVEAGIQQIFDVSAKGVSSYRFESISNITLFQNKLVYPEWWGIFPNIVPGKNGDTGPKDRNHTFLKEMMLDIAASGGGTIQFSEGVYYIRDIVIDSNNITVRGKGISTILRFDRENYGYSTRRGGIFTIQGPTTEKYYSKVFTEGRHIGGNFLYDKDQYPIENINVSDLSIEWHPDATAEDPSMNGLTIVNAINVEIDNVFVNLFGANRAFYIGSVFEGAITENITIKNCKGIESRTGVFIVHGYDSKDYIRNKMSLGNILIENNVFDVVSIPELDIKNVHIVEKYLDKYATGFYFIGNEFTKTFQLGDTTIERNLGPVVIKNNTINNADIGIRSWVPGEDERKDYTQRVTVEGNTFKNFKYIGIFMPFSEAVIKNNSFIVNQLTPLTYSFREANEEGFIATAIHIAKAPWEEFKSKQGPTNILIEGNTISGCFLGTTPIVVQPNEEGKVELRNNTITYDPSCKAPQNDIIVTTNRRKFRTKKATIVLKNNIEDTSNQNPEQASVLIDARRKKHITILNEEE